jgi:protoporphyrinogen oxidase
VDGFRKAVEMGYRLKDVFEFWEYEVTCFDKDTNSGGLFAEYVKMFLKLKQVSSGYPSWVQSERQMMNTLRTIGAQRELL